MIRLKRFTRWAIPVVAVAGSAAAVAAAIIAWNAATRFRDIIFPAFANTGTSRSLAPVDVSLKSSQGETFWKIPKAYLTSTVNWKSGPQDFITMEAAVNWSALELSPWANSSQQKREDHVYISLRPALRDYPRYMWDKYYAPAYAAKETLGDLAIYVHQDASYPSPVNDAYTRVFRPVNAASVEFFTCHAPKGVLIVCTAHAQIVGSGTLDYVFSGSHLDQWRDIDAAMRRLFDSLRVN